MLMVYELDQIMIDIWSSFDLKYNMLMVYELDQIMIDIWEYWW